MKKIDAFRFGVFWVWSGTLCATLGIFIWCIVSRSMTFKEIDESLTQVMGLIVPQVSIMIAFFLGSTKDEQQELLERQHSLGTFAVGLSALYHVVFWIVMWLAIGLGIFGTTIDENTTAAIKILGFVSIFGLSPVAYLFASGAAAKAQP